jgi:hypothetical protein
MAKRSNRSRSTNLPHPIVETKDPKIDASALTRESVADMPGDDEPTIPVKLKFDAWSKAGRHKKGDTVPLPVSDATRLIDEGKADRADPLPKGRKK